MPICSILEEMHILVPQGKTTPNISGFLLASGHGYYTEGGGDIEAKIC
jgi:hypothetical protein